MGEDSSGQQGMWGQIYDRDLERAGRERVLTADYWHRVRWRA
jgi:hypothetical protein